MNTKGAFVQIDTSEDPAYGHANVTCLTDAIVTLRRLERAFYHQFRLFQMNLNLFKNRNNFLEVLF